MSRKETKDIALQHGHQVRCLTQGQTQAQQRQHSSPVQIFQVSLRKGFQALAEE